MVKFPYTDRKKKFPGRGPRCKTSLTSLDFKVLRQHYFLPHLSIIVISLSVVLIIKSVSFFLPKFKSVLIGQKNHSNVTCTSAIDWYKLITQILSSVTFCYFFFASFTRHSCEMKHFLQRTLIDALCLQQSSSFLNVQQQRHRCRVPASDEKKAEFGVFLQKLPLWKNYCNKSLYRSSGSRPSLKRLNLNTLGGEGAHGIWSPR